ncbi:MAG: type I restriction endonuclease subunit M [Pirellulales bacterium]|nr:type I restriction endonuclease subunit M [Pirellulales bacterium]
MAGVSFPLGLLVATPGALDRVPHEERLIALGRHADGDWGDCCPEDWHSNNSALADGLRLFSVYHTFGGTKFWIITEADRSVTTILLPEEY